MFICFKNKALIPAYIFSLSVLHDEIISNYAFVRIKEKDRYLLPLIVLILNKTYYGN